MAYSLVQQNSYCISGFQRKSIDFHQSKKFTQSQIVRKVTCVNSQSFCPSLWYDRRSHTMKFFRCHFETSTLSCSIFGLLIWWIDWPACRERNAGVHGSFWTWYRYWKGQHRHQLRHARWKYPSRTWRCWSANSSNSHARDTQNMNLVESKMKDVGTVQNGAESNPETAEFRARCLKK